MLAGADPGPGVMSRGMARHSLPTRDRGARQGWHRGLAGPLAGLAAAARTWRACPAAVPGRPGRAGTIAALMLTERGLPRRDAMASVRAVCPGAVAATGNARWIARMAKLGGARGLRLRASLIAGAIGDSLGAAVKFLPLAGIRRRFPGRPTGLPPHDGMRGVITDDTQMTALGA